MEKNEKNHKKKYISPKISNLQNWEDTQVQGACSSGISPGGGIDACSSGSAAFPCSIGSLAQNTCSSGGTVL